MDYAMWPLAILTVAASYALIAYAVRWPARKSSRAGVIPAPEPREPLDPGRPFLFDIEQLEDRNDPRLIICPVCGLTDPGNLSGEVRGWPAHQSCQEWLGDWKPKFLPGSEFRPSRPAR